jgi:hypothetical protein
MNDVVHKPTLQEKVSARIREQIGELIEPEDLQRLVDQAMQDAFFKPRPNPDYRGYSSQSATIEPLIHATVRMLLQKPVDEAVQAWIDANGETIQKAIDTAVREGVAGIVLKVFDSKMQGDLFMFGDMVSRRLRSGKGLNEL